MKGALIEVSEECHFQELGYHLTFHSFNMSLEHRFLKLIENAPVIEEEWAKAMDVAVMQELKKFGQ